MAAGEVCWLAVLGCPRFGKGFLQEDMFKVPADGQIAVWKADPVSYTEKPPLPGTAGPSPAQLPPTSCQFPAAHTPGPTGLSRGPPPRPALPRLLVFLAPPPSARGRCQRSRAPELGHGSPPREDAAHGCVTNLVSSTLPTLLPLLVPQYSSPKYTSIFLAELKMPTETIPSPPLGSQRSERKQGFSSGLFWLLFRITRSRLQRK